MQALLKKCAGELKHASNDRAIHMLANLVAEDVLTGGVPGAVVYDDDKLDQVYIYDGKGCAYRNFWYARMLSC